MFGTIVIELLVKALWYLYFDMFDYHDWQLLYFEKVESKVNMVCIFMYKFWHCTKLLICECYWCYCWGIQWSKNIVEMSANDKGWFQVYELCFKMVIMHRNLRTKFWKSTLQVHVSLDIWPCTFIGNFSLCWLMPQVC